MDDGRPDETREEMGTCADCGKYIPTAFMEGKWCEDCFDIGLKADMHEHFVYSVKKDLEGKC